MKKKLLLLVALFGCANSGAYLNKSIDALSRWKDRAGKGASLVEVIGVLEAALNDMKQLRDDLDSLATKANVAADSVVQLSVGMTSIAEHVQGLIGGEKRTFTRYRTDKADAVALVDRTIERLEKTLRTAQREATRGFGNVIQVLDQALQDMKDVRTRLETLAANAHTASVTVAETEGAIKAMVEGIGDFVE